MIGEGHIFLTLHRTMTTEYTVLQVRNPRDERHKVRRQDDSFKEVMGQANLAARYLYGSPHTVYTRCGLPW